MKHKYCQLDDHSPYQRIKLHNSTPLSNAIMHCWCGRVALVTSASSGIGAGIAASLVKNGMIVLGVARNVERIKVSLLVGLKVLNIFYRNY